ncbi:hypothetical protein [Fodinibius saliphilus]|uniref:hypothetical protein n=1 Tax=Fodinibius saliphilus TaxID=1920650 RepID=UPI0011097EE7|nr:hypothetical protein [Fodinibius saliphilus]
MAYNIDNYLDENGNMILDGSGESYLKRLVQNELSDMLEDVQESDPIFYQSIIKEIDSIMREFRKEASVYPDDTLEELMQSLKDHLN